MSPWTVCVLYDLAGLAIALVLGALPFAAWRRRARQRQAEQEWSDAAAVRAEADRQIAEVES